MYSRVKTISTFMYPLLVFTHLVSTLNEFIQSQTTCGYILPYLALLEGFFEDC